MANEKQNGIEGKCMYYHSVPKRRWHNVEICEIIHCNGKKPGCFLFFPKNYKPKKTEEQKKNENYNIDLKVAA